VIEIITSVHNDGQLFWRKVSGKPINQLGTTNSTG
jgi:hypothetical protein